MAKDVKFNIKLNVDGKDVVVQASTNVQQLADKLGVVHDKVTAADRAFFQWSQSVQGLSSVSNAVGQLNSVLQNITGDSMNFAKAMKQANTMAGKDAAGFDRLKDQVADLSKEIPIARDELANGLYMVVSNGVPEDNWKIFENTQEAIIDEDTFEKVQKIRANVRRYPDGWGEVHALTGLMYCADCGAKMYVHRTSNGKRIKYSTY